jgi:serine/threonine protein kinase
VARQGEWVGPFEDPDRYELVESRSSGGEGELWQAHRPLDRMLLTVAIKIVHERHLTNVSEWRTRWQRQAELLRSLNHPALVRVREFFEGPPPHRRGDSNSSERTLYLAMNWEKGVSLHSWVRMRSAGDVAQGLQFVHRIAEAVDYLHSGADTGGVAVIHRDIKPANIIITSSTVRLVDFGLARLHGTGSLSFGGTPHYLAPETLRGEFGLASDLYALGATAYYVIVGQAPAESEFDRLAALRTVQLSDPDPLASAVMEMLDPNPRHRPESATDWAAKLVRLATAQAAVRPSAPSPPLRLPAVPPPADDPDAETFSEPGRNTEIGPPSRIPELERLPRQEPAIDETVADPPSTETLGGTPGDRLQRRRRLAIPVGASFLVVLLASIALAIGMWPDSGGEAPRSASSSTTSTSPVTTTTTPAPVVAFPSAGTVTAGRYNGGSFKPSVTLQVGAGWTSLGTATDGVDMARTQRPTRTISIIRVQRVYQPDRFSATAENTAATALNAIESVPEDLPSWLKSLPSTFRSEIRDITVGGMSGKEIDLSLSGVRYEGCSGACLPLFQYEPSPPQNQTSAFIRYTGQRIRFQVFEFGVAKVVVAMSAPVDEFDEFINEVRSGFAVQSWGGAANLASIRITAPSGPVKAGQPATLVAEIRGQCADTQTGTLVSFYEGAIRDNKLYGSAPIQAGGRATLEVSSIRASDRPAVGIVVAQWSGASDCEKTTSPPLFVTITP